MLVREVMSVRPTTVAEGATVKEALSLLAREGITAVPVVAGGTLCGVLSEADLIRSTVARDPRAHEILGEERPPPPRLVSEVMTREVLTVRPDTELAAAVGLMTANGVKSLPVVDRDGGLVGIVSRSDVVRLLARADRSIERDVAGLLASVGRPEWQVGVRDGVVAVSGPADAPSRSLARAVAGSVPGVIHVRVA